jgi:cytochrome c553|tara:strand:- start:844 stop:1455 length:612 start_codon:yes stop_codon:yes gene_type:complete
MKIQSLLVVGLLVAVTALPVYAAGDVDSGRAAAATCMGCHGAPGLRNTYPPFRVPKLGGQQAEYLAIALKAYQSGGRSHPTMQAQANTLSNQTITDIATYLSSLVAANDGEKGKGNAAAGEKKAQACIPCHGPGGGKPLTPQYPVLAGQYPDFIAYALTGYKSGSRNNAIMKGLVTALSDADMQDVAAYFASQPSSLSTPTKW